MRPARNRVLPVSLALLLTPPLVTHAQAPAPGTRVRVSVHNTLPAQRIGTLVSLRGDTLTWRAEHDTATIATAVAALTSLDTSAGISRRTQRGATIGAATGLALDVAILLAWRDPSPNPYFPGGVSPTAGRIGAAVCAASLLIGAGIGWSVKSDRWMPVALQRTAIFVAPAAVGRVAALRLGVRVRPPAPDGGS